MSLLAGAGVMGMAWRFGLSWDLPAHLVLVAVTTVLVVTDFDHLRLPNRVVYPGTALVTLLLGAGAAASGRGSDFGRGLLGAAAYFLLFLLVYLVAKGDGFGFGDVKLAVMLGLIATYQSWRSLVLSLFLTALLGGIPALVMLAMGRSAKTSLPYGPPLIIGTWLAIIAGPFLG